MRFLGWMALVTYCTLVVFLISGIVYFRMFQDRPVGQELSVPIMDLRPQALALVRQTLAARPWGSLDCLQQHTKYSQSTFDVTMLDSGAIQVRHVTTVGTYVWQVFVAEKLVNPLQRPAESFY